MVSVAEKFPVYALDAIPVVTSFPSIGEAIDNHNYEMASNYATDIIDEIKKNLLFTVLEHRAYAFHKMNKYQDAICDAQEMVSIAPSSTKSYLLLGKLYSALGKQEQAIDIYKTALQQKIVTPQDSNNSIWMQQVVEEMNKAIQQNEKRIDPVSRLSRELLSTIFTYLDQESKITCWDVSKKWRYSLTRASSAWSTLYVNENDYHIDHRLINHLRDVGTYVRHLTLHIIFEDIVLDYLESMNNGDFDHIKSLKLAIGAFADPINLAMFESFITTVLPRIGHTLTQLDLNFFCIETDAVRAVNLCAILASAPHLTHLVYWTAELLSTAIGDFSVLANVENHHPLIDLDLQASRVTRNDMEPLLDKCGKLRCLKLSGSDENMIHLLESHCPHLQILFYDHNRRSDPMIPDEVYTQFKKTICTATSTELTRGLKVLYVDFHFMSRREPDPAILASRYVPSLILDNQATLEVIDISGCPTMPNLRDHPLDIPNLKSLRISITEKNHQLQQLFLRSIPSFTNLHTLQLTNAETSIPLMDILMTLNRPLKNLKLTFPKASNNESNQINSSLIRLLQYYITLQPSSPPTLAELTTTTCLESISIEDQSSNLSEEVLNVLSDIKTIRSIGIYTRSPNISIEALTDLFKKLSSGKVTYLEIGGLPNVKDDDIIRFIDILKRHLSFIYFHELDHITAYGIVMIMEKAKHLKKFKVEHCKLFKDTGTSEIIAKMKGIEPDMEVPN